MKRLLTPWFVACACVASLLVVIGIGQDLKADIGCFICQYEGGSGITGPSRDRCHQVGDEEYGAGIYCTNVEYDNLGSTCKIWGGACFYFTVPSDPGDPTAGGAIE